MRTCDVAVVGAGPAGSAAACSLARAGLDVIVLDKASFPRDKTCGDGLTTGALRELDHLGLEPSAVASWNTVDGCWVRSPSGRRIELPMPPGPGTFAAVARRVDLDAALVALARDAGACVQEGQALSDVSWREEGVALEVAGGDSVSARFVVAADGMWSAARRLVGDDHHGYLGEWHAFRQYFRATGPLARRLWVWFEPDLLPGYAWSFPLPDGGANVGFGIKRRRGVQTRTMAEQWRGLLERPAIREVLGPDAVAESATRAWPIPARLSRSMLAGAGGRVLFVGDAARASDPMTGEGIAQALETARLAAGAIIAAGPSRPQVAAAAYAHELATGMVIDHGLGRALSGLLSSTRCARGALRIVDATPWTRRNVARWLFEDYPRAIVATPWRWPHARRGAPGAFTRASGAS